MKQLRKFGVTLSVTCIFCLLFSGLAVGESPEETLKTIVGKIKAAENPAPVVDYVKWSDVYAGLSEQEKTGLQVKSPADMKTLYRKMLSNPALATKEQFAARVREQAGGNEAMVDQVMAQFETQMAAKQNELKQRIRETTYEVGSSTVEGDTALVELSQTYQGETKTDKVRMVKGEEGQWLLTSLGMAKQGE